MPRIPVHSINCFHADYVLTDSRFVRARYCLSATLSLSFKKLLELIPVKILAKCRGTLSLRIESDNYYAILYLNAIQILPTSGVFVESPVKTLI